jgi:hypothetical protein
VVRKELEHRFDDQLGGRPGNEDVRVDFELQPPELPVSDDVGERLSRGAPGDERVVGLGKGFGLRAAGVTQIAFGRPVEHLLREQTRIEVRLDRRNARLAQLLPSRGDSGLDRSRHECNNPTSPA